MQKLQLKKNTKLLQYYKFIKNNNLKKNQHKLKYILFENHILYKNRNLESSVIEFNTYKNIYLPFTLINFSEISTIALKHNNVYLFTYDLTYNILNHFNKLMLQKNLSQRGDIIKGRLLGSNWNNKKIFISVFGFIFCMKPFHLNKFLNFKKKPFFKKFNKKIFFKKKLNSTKVINCYKLKYLNFNINFKYNKKNELSRVSYLKKLFEQQKIKKHLNNPEKNKKAFFQVK